MKSMKNKMLRISLAMFLICMINSAVSAEETVDTIYLTREGINVQVLSDYNTALEDDGFYYVYAGKEGMIPYVMFGEYTFTKEDFFRDGFTDLMKSHYLDLTIAEEEQEITVGDYQMQKIVYNYDISGYQCRDTRLAAKMGNYVIMFCSKEVPELNLMTDDLLTEVASGLQEGEWESLIILEETKK